MSTTYPANPANTPAAKLSITIPVDGDTASAASVNNPGPLENDADILEYLLEQNAIDAATSFLLCPSTSQNINGMCWSPPASASTLDPAVMFVGASGMWQYSASVGGSTIAALGSLSGIGTTALNSVASNGTNLVVAVGAVISAGNTAIGKYTPGNANPTLVTNSFTSALNSIAWSTTLGLFAAVGASGLIVTSPDGATWTSRSGGSGTLNWIQSGNGLFVCGANGTTTYFTSADGITWSSHTAPGTLSGTSVNYSPIVWSQALGLWLLTEITTQKLWTSTDCINWTARLTSAQTVGGSWAPYVSGRIACAGSPGLNYLYTSFDGINWTRRQQFGSNNANAYTFTPAFPNGSLGAFVQGSTNGIFVTYPLPTP